MYIIPRRTRNTRDNLVRPTRKPLHSRDERTTLTNRATRRGLPKPTKAHDADLTAEEIDSLKELAKVAKKLLALTEEPNKESKKKAEEPEDNSDLDEAPEEQDIEEFGEEDTEVLNVGDSKKPVINSKKHIGANLKKRDSIDNVSYSDKQIEAFTNFYKSQN